MASADNIFVAVSFFALVIFFIVIGVFWTALYSQATDLWTGSSVGTQIRDDGQNLYDTFDFIMVIVYFGLHLGILVMAFLLRTHPVVYVVSIVLVAVLAMVAAPLSNAYEDFQAEPDIISVANDMPMTNMIMDKLPIFEIIWGFITAIVMFGLARYEGYI